MFVRLCCRGFAVFAVGWVFAGVLPGVAGGAEVPAGARAAWEQSGEIAFIGSYAAWLGKLDAGEVAASRGAVAAACPEDRRRMALELLESRWAKLDPDGYLTASEDGRGGYSESVRKRAFVAFFRKDREAAMARFERSSLRERWHDATIMLGEAAGNDPGWMVGRCARLPEWQGDIAILPKYLYELWYLRDPDAAWAALWKEPIRLVREQVAPLLMLRRLDDPRKAAEWIKSVPTAGDERMDLVGQMESGALNAGAQGKLVAALAAWDDPDGWDELMERADLTIGPEKTVEILVPLLPEKRRLEVVRGFLIRKYNHVPQAGWTGFDLVAAITDDKLREALLADARDAGLPPDLPPLDNKRLAQIYWEEPEVFEDLVWKLAAMAPRDWAEKLFREDPDAALRNMLAREDMVKLRDWEPRCLMKALPPERVCKTVADLLDRPTDNARSLGAALAGEWICADPKAALPEMVERHADGLAAWLDSNTYHAMGHCQNRDEVASCFKEAREKLHDPRMIGRVDCFMMRHFGMDAGGVDGVLGKIRHWPPNAARQEVFRSMLNTGGMSLETLLAKVLALDAERDGEFRDEVLLAMATCGADRLKQGGACFGKWMEAFSSPGKRLQALEYLAQSSAGIEGPLMDVLAAQPAGARRDELMRRCAESWVRRAPEDALRKAASPCSPVAAAELLGRLADAGAGEKLSADAVGVALAAQPPTPRTRELADRLSRSGIISDPAAAWRRLLAADWYMRPAARTQAMEILRQWSRKDPKAALAAWLSFPATWLLRDSAGELAEACFGNEIRAGIVPPPPPEDRDHLLARALALQLAGKHPAQAARLMLLTPCRDEPDPCVFELFRTGGQAGAEGGWDGTRWVEFLPAGPRHVAFSRAVMMIALQDSPPYDAGAFCEAATGREPRIIEPFQAERRERIIALLAKQSADFVETRQNMSAVVKFAPRNVAETYANARDPRTKSAMRLGWFDAALRAGDEHKLTELTAEITRSGDPREQAEAALGLMKRAMTKDAETLPGVLAAIPWPDARYTATHAAIAELLKHDDRESARAVARAYDDPVHRDELAALAIESREILDRPEVLQRAANLVVAVEVRAEIARALAAGRPDAALLAALGEPDEDAAPLLAHILKNLPDRAAREAAVAALPDEARRERVRKLSPDSAR